MTIEYKDVRIIGEWKRNRIDMQKLRLCVEQYGQTGELKPITLDKDNVLIDGYYSFLTAQFIGLHEIPYVRGVRPDEKKEKNENRVEFSNTVRREIYNKTNGICKICGKPVSMRKFTIEHYIPLDKGGTNDIENLYPAHSVCNAQKGDKSINEYCDDLTETITYHAREDRQIVKIMVKATANVIKIVAMEKAKTFMF